MPPLSLDSALGQAEVYGKTANVFTFVFLRLKAPIIACVQEVMEEEAGRDLHCR